MAQLVYILSALLAISTSLLVLAYSSQNLTSPPQTPMALNNAAPLYPIVALGVYRHVAAGMDPLFTNTPFRMTAIMDLMQEPKSIRYNPHNMLAVLYNLHPRPKVFITGAAISQGMTHESIQVWNSYVKESKEKDTFVINVSATRARLRVSSILIGVIAL